MLNAQMMAVTGWVEGKCRTEPLSSLGDASVTTSLDWYLTTVAHALVTSRLYYYNILYQGLSLKTVQK